MATSRPATGRPVTLSRPAGLALADARHTPNTEAGGLGPQRHRQTALAKTGASAVTSLAIVADGLEGVPLVTSAA